MENKTADMEDIFSKLTDENKDILILVAKSIKMAQETEYQNVKPVNYFK